MLGAEVSRLTTSSMVPARYNKLPVAGQTPHKAAGPEPQQTPTPLTSQTEHAPLQVYEMNRPFFGSAPVGGLGILCSKSSMAPLHATTAMCCQCRVLLMPYALNTLSVLQGH